MKKNALFLIFFQTTSTLLSTNNYYKIINDNSLKTYIEKKSPQYPCEKCHKKELIDCIFSLNCAAQRETFAHLPTDKQREFLRNLDVPNYEKFLKAYNEYQWQELYNKLSEYEQSHWPKTVKEQINALEKIKQEAESARNVLGFGTTLALTMINPPLCLSFQAYEIYHILRYDEHPMTANYLKAAFKKYMESTFEI